MGGGATPLQGWLTVFKVVKKLTLKRLLTSNNGDDRSMTILGHLSFHLDPRLNFSDDQGALINMNTLFFACVIHDDVKRTINFQ